MYLEDELETVYCADPAALLRQITFFEEKGIVDKDFDWSAFGIFKDDLIRRAYSDQLYIDLSNQSNSSNSYQ